MLPTQSGSSAGGRVTTVSGPAGWQSYNSTCIPRLNLSKPRLVVYQITVSPSPRLRACRKTMTKWYPDILCQSWLRLPAGTRLACQCQTVSRSQSVSLSDRRSRGCVRAVQTQSKHWLSQLRHPSLEEGAATECDARSQTQALVKLRHPSFDHCRIKV